MSPHLLQDNIFHKANSGETERGKEFRAKNVSIDNGYGPIINDTFESREGDKQASH